MPESQPHPLEAMATVTGVQVLYLSTEVYSEEESSLSWELMPAQLPSGTVIATGHLEVIGDGFRARTSVLSTLWAEEAHQELAGYGGFIPKSAEEVVERIKHSYLHHQLYEGAAMALRGGLAMMDAPLRIPYATPEPDTIRVMKTDNQR